jgi:hypothetical protein
MSREIKFGAATPLEAIMSRRTASLKHGQFKIFRDSPCQQRRNRIRFWSAPMSFRTRFVSLPKGTLGSPMVQRVKKNWDESPRTPRISTTTASKVCISVKWSSAREHDCDVVE